MQILQEFKIKRMILMEQYRIPIFSINVKLIMKYKLILENILILMHFLIIKIKQIIQLNLMRKGM